MSSYEVCHLCQQAIRRAVHWDELEAAVRFVIQDNRAALFRFPGIGSPDDNPGGSLDSNGITLRDQRANGLRELTIKTPDPDVLFLDQQEHMMFVNRTLESGFAFRYFHLTFPFLL